MVLRGGLMTEPRIAHYGSTPKLRIFLPVKLSYGLVPELRLTLHGRAMVDSLEYMCLLVDGSAVLEHRLVVKSICRS